MTEEIIIDVNGCPHKSDDDCMEVPICNEYGDLMGYQSCEAQTLCPYRSQKKIERLEQENKELKKQIESQKGLITVGGKQQYEYLQKIDKLEQENKELKTKLDVFAFTISQYESALEEILESAKFAQCLPCGSGNLEDCLNCNDDTTNNGQFCMEKRIHDIKTKCVEVLGY